MSAGHGPGILQHQEPTGYPQNIGDTLEMKEITHVSPETKSPDVEVQQIDPTKTRATRATLSQLVRKKPLLVIYAAATGKVLLFTLISLIWARAKYDVVGDVGTISQGTCPDMEKLDSNLHLIINILSTIVLVASYSFMLVAYSPSRAEIDVAHERRHCLSVGSLGFGNLRDISWKKTLIYLLLMVTSSPFHLLANSTIITRMAANGYNWAVVSQQFVIDKNHTQPIISLNRTLSEPEMKVLTNIQESSGAYETLSNDDCVGAYSDVYQRTHRTLLLVVPNTVGQGQKNVSQIFKLDKSFAGKGANNWICGHTQSEENTSPYNIAPFKCDTGKNPLFTLLGTPHWQNWEIFNQEVSYCLSEKADSVCSVQYSPTIMALLIVCNTLKLAAMIFILFFSDWHDQPICCPGDAAASFLEREDPTTLGMCLATRKGVRKLWANPRPKPYKDRLRRAWRGIPRHRWAFFWLSMLGFLFGIFVLIFVGVSTAKGATHEYHFFSNFGKVNTDILSSPNQMSVLEITGTANVAHFVLAVMWILYRDIITSMYYAHDWSAYEYKAQALMVSRNPEGDQRRKWLLDLPWIDAIYLLLLQMLMHFLISQSIFAVRIQAYDENGVNDPAHAVSNIGYSPVAILVSFLVCLFLLATLFLVAKQRMDSSAPIVGTCSAAVSAACHPTIRVDGMERGYLRWGEVQNNQGVLQRHCSLTSAAYFDMGQASAAVAGVLYA